MINVYMISKSFLVYENKDISTLLNKNFGVKNKDNLVLSDFEAAYLFEKKKVKIYDLKKELSQKDLFKKIGKNIEKYKVFCDLKKKGFIVKTALKFGFDFRVYEKKHKNSHSKYFVKVFFDNDKINSIELLKNNRISNTAKKELILAFVDKEFSITYLKTNWVKNL